VNILIVSPDPPLPANYGARVRLLNLMRHLSACAHEVSLLCFTEVDWREHYRRQLLGLCRRVIVIPRPAATTTEHLVMRARSVVHRTIRGTPENVLAHRSFEMNRLVGELTSTGNYDVIMVEYSFMGDYATKARRVLRVLDEVDVESIRWRRASRFADDPAKRLHYRLLADRARRHEDRVIKQFDQVIAVTDPDKTYIDQRYPGVSTITVPACVDLEAFPPSSKPSRQGSLLFVGSFNHLPNADAVEFFLKECFPLIRHRVPEAHLVIVGRNWPQSPAPSARQDVTVHGTVEDVRPYLYECSVFVAPIRFGAGIKIKILESMAAGRPVVTTRMGAEGIDAVPGRDLIVADRPREFAAQVVRLLRSPGLRERIGRQGRERIVEKYTWAPHVKAFIEQAQTLLPYVRQRRPFRFWRGRCGRRKPF